MTYRPAALFAASTLALAAASTAVPAVAQDSVPQPAEAEDVTSDGGEGNEIVVVATRFPGEVETDQPPVLTLNEAEIASYGAGNISDLLAALAPQTGSGRGRGGGGGPVVLLNGQRISGFRELRNVPPEAIRKVEVLPE